MNARIMILSLLAERPMHGYEVLRTLKVSRIDLWTDIKAGSVYHALKTLADKGLVEVTGITQRGHRSRAEYAITSAGRQAFKDLLHKAIDRPHMPFSPSFFVVMSCWSQLPKRDRRALVKVARRRLQEALEAWAPGRAFKGKRSAAPPHVRLMFESGLKHLRLNAALLDRLEELESTG